MKLLATSLLALMILPSLRQEMLLKLIWDLISMGTLLLLPTLLLLVEKLPARPQMLFKLLIKPFWQPLELFALEAATRKLPRILAKSALSLSYSQFKEYSPTKLRSI